MRIFLSTDAVGGVWDYTCTLAHALSGWGHALFVAVVGDPSPERLAALPAGVRLETRDLRLEWMPDSGADVAEAGRWLSDRAREWRADVVHLNQLAYSVADFAAPTIVVVHSDVLSWFSEVRGHPAPATWECYSAMVGRGIAAADVVVAPSVYQSELTRRHYGRAADVVIHNGAEPTGAPRPRGSGELLVSVGRAWDEAKGMETFDRAIGILADRAPEAHLVGQTAGPQGQRFTARHLICHGVSPREEVTRWMNTATAYVGASRYEPFGLAPLEAALHGCALLLADIGSFRELWSDCAEFFPRGDAEALAETIVELGRDEERRNSLALRARERALDRYGAERFAREYVALYDEVSCA